MGFLPLKLRFGSRRESTALLVQYFGEALELRRNHPRIIPEAYQLAGVAMDQVGIKRDFIVDENAPSYSPWRGVHDARDERSRLLFVAANREGAVAQARNIRTPEASLRVLQAAG